jgi:Zn-dependent protease
MSDFNNILLLLPGIIVGFTVHEYMHAYVALLLGDPTAKDMGRFTLNPLKHIDPVGFILLIAAGFGWARPVVINRANLRHPDRDDMLIAVAGPVSNLALSLIGAALFAALLQLLPAERDDVTRWILHATLAGIYVNMGLFLFNMIPIPPLDGSHLLRRVLGIKDEMNVKMFYRYGTMLLLGVIVAERVFRIDILPIGKAVSFLVNNMLRFFGVGH